MNKPSASNAAAEHADGYTCSVSVRNEIYNHLARSAGTANWATDHRLMIFLEMIRDGDATWDDFQKIGGDWLAREIKRVEAEYYGDE